MRILTIVLKQDLLLVKCFQHHFTLPPRVHALQQEKPPQWEACAPQLESSPTPTTRESPHTAGNTQHRHKSTNKYKIFFKTVGLFFINESYLHLHKILNWRTIIENVEVAWVELPWVLPRVVKMSYIASYTNNFLIKLFLHTTLKVKCCNVEIKFLKMWEDLGLKSL